MRTSFTEMSQRKKINDFRRKTYDILYEYQPRIYVVLLHQIYSIYDVKDCQDCSDFDPRLLGSESCSKGFPVFQYAFQCFRSLQ